MKKMSNKAIALIALAPWVLILIIGFVKGFIGTAAPLPFFLESLLAFIGVILTFYAFYRLYKAPNAPML